LFPAGAAGADARSEVQRVRWGRKLAPADKYDGTVLLFTRAAGADAHVQRVKESLSSTISSLMGSMFSRWGARWRQLANTMEWFCFLQEQLVQTAAASSTIGSLVNSSLISLI